MVWLTGLLLTALGCIAYLGWRVARARRRIAVLETEIDKLGRDLAEEDREFERYMAEIGGSRIVIELIDPLALAREHSRWIGALGGLAPRMIRRRVYDRAAAEMKRVMTAEAIAAELYVFHPTGS